VWVGEAEAEEQASEPIATVTVIARREERSQLVPRLSVYSLLSRLTVVPQLTCALFSLSLPSCCAGS
jgi:hypothetical protein